MLKSWFGVAVPLDTPYEIKEKLATGLEAMIAAPLFVDNMNKLGIQVEYLAPPKNSAKMDA